MATSKATFSRLKASAATEQDVPSQAQQVELAAKRKIVESNNKARDEARKEIARRNEQAHKKAVVDLARRQRLREEGRRGLEF